MNGDLKTAIPYYNRAIEINPKFFQAIINRANTKFYLNDFYGAIEDCNYLLNLLPEDKIANDLKSKALKAFQNHF